MTCSLLAMRVPQIPDLRWIDRSTRLWGSQTTGPEKQRSATALPRRSERWGMGGPSRGPPSSSIDLSGSSIDLVGAAGRRGGGRGGLGLGSMTVAVPVALAVAGAEGQRRLHLELRLQARAPLLPALLVLQLVLVQRGG